MLKINAQVMEVKSGVGWEQMTRDESSLNNTSNNKKNSFVSCEFVHQSAKLLSRMKHSTAILSIEGHIERVFKGGAGTVYSRNME